MTTAAGGSIRIVPLTEDLRAQAEFIARQAYSAECEHVPTLPAEATLPSLSTFFGNGMGVAALRANTAAAESSMLGYLSAYQAFDDAFGVPGLRGTFAPVEAMGVHPEVGGAEARARVVTAMYASAADLWARAGAASHAIAIYAHDPGAESALLKLGFGVRCSDAIASTAALKAAVGRGAGAGADSIAMRELVGAEVSRLIGLANGLIRHLNGAPSFLAHASLTEADLVTQARRGARFFAAELKGEPVAYLRISVTGENFAVAQRSTRSITGAFCTPELRGSGIAARLMSHVATELELEGVERVGVDFETLNPAANGLWSKHLTPYTCSLVRRLDALPLVG